MSSSPMSAARERVTALQSDLRNDHNGIPRMKVAGAQVVGGRRCPIGSSHRKAHVETADDGILVATEEEILSPSEGHPRALANNDLGLAVSQRRFQEEKKRMLAQMAAHSQVQSHSHCTA